MTELKRVTNLAALAFFIGFWLATGAGLGVTMVVGLVGFDADYVMVINEPEECEGGPCG
jgi:hypothetical protein